MSVISKYLSEIGKKGGKAGIGDAKRRTSAQASAAAKARWDKERNAKKPRKRKTK